MIVLCDTCSVLMVIRIAPDMFTDDRYGCATTVKVHDELFEHRNSKKSIHGERIIKHTSVP